MAVSRSEVFLLCAIGLIFLARPAAAFGAGNIASLSKVEGVNWRHGDIEDIILTLAAAKSMSGKKFSKLDIKRVCHSCRQRHRLVLTMSRSTLATGFEITRKQSTLVRSNMSAPKRYASCCGCLGSCRLATVQGSSSMMMFSRLEVRTDVEQGHHRTPWLLSARRAY
jgi:hypothetical protein